MNESEQTITGKILDGTVAIVSLKDLKELLFSDAPTPKASKKTEEGPTPPQGPLLFVDLDGNPIYPCQKGQERLFSIKQVCKILNVTPCTVNRWHRIGVLPKYEFEGSSKIYFRESDILSRLKSVISQGPFSAQSQDDNVD